MRLTAASGCRHAAVAVLVLTCSWLDNSWAFAGDTVELGGEGNQVTGLIERHEGRGAPSQATAVQVSTNPGRRGAPAAPAPAADWRKDRIVYTNDNGTELHYVFDNSGRDCHGAGARVTCYGPEPDAPRRPRDRDAPPPPISPQEIVERTLVNVRLPRPEPSIDPGYAITGLRSYLETGNSTTHTFPPIATVLGPLSITATSTYTIDWGDGTVTGPHASSGGEYPDGDITHVYQRREVVDVTVTQHWTAHWSLAGQSGTISGLRSSGTLDGFAVDEVQASRRR